jgi:HlyD family secretion protein
VFRRFRFTIARTAAPLLVSGALLSSACGSSEPSPAAAPEAPAASPYLAVAKGQVDVEGGVYRLAAARDGIVTGVFVEDGEAVAQGQLLARIDDRQPRLALAQADAQLAQARAELPVLDARLQAAERERLRLAPLAADDTATRRELDQAADEVRVLTAQIAQAQSSVTLAARARAVAAYELEQRAVRAPMDGRIVRRQARLGDGVSTLNVTPLFLFTPNTPRIIRAEVDERFVDRVRAGQAAEILLEVDEKRQFKGRVLRVGQVFGNKQATGDPSEAVDVRIVECVVSIDDQSLRIGQRVHVRILPDGGRS